jgi:hypothetical protein
MDRTALRVTAIAAVVGPLLVLASTLCYIAYGEGLNNGEAGGIVQVWAFIALGIAVIGLARLLEASTPRGALLVIVLGIGGVAAGAGYGIDSIVGEVHGVASLQDVDSSPAAPLALQLPGLMHTLSLVTVGVLLARYRVVPAMVGYAVVAGAVLFLVARIPDVQALAVVGDLTLLLGLGGVGLTLLGRGAERSEILGATG